MLPVAALGAGCMVVMNQLLYAFLPRMPVDFWNGFSSQAVAAYLAFVVAPAHKWKVGMALVILSFAFGVFGVVAGHLGLINAPQWRIIVFGLCCVGGSVVGCVIADAELSATPHNLPQDLDRK